MANVISIDDDGIKIKPEIMEKEKLYHCIFKNKILLFYKDEEEILNCFEIEEQALVDKVKKISTDEDVEKILEEYIKENKLNIK